MLLDPVVVPLAPCLNVSDDGPVHADARYSKRYPLPMPRQQKLKVYRTPIGFHDAYVAAPSQKAALEAWGSDANLFARGIAEIVTDEALISEPLDNPGKVIKRLRGTAEEQLAALPPDRPKQAEARRSREIDASDKSAPRSPRGKTAARTVSREPAPKPRPSRAMLDAAESKLDELVKTQDVEEGDLRRRERDFARERRELDRVHERGRRNAERAVEKEREAHSDALSRWLNANK